MKKRSFTKLLSFVLAFVLTATSVLPSLPMEQVQAATPKIWYHVEGGSGNGNGHSYSQAGSGSAALLLHKTGRTTFGQTYSLTFEKQGDPASARLGFFYTYLDDNNWLYVGMNPDGSWYYEYKIAGTQSWPSLNNLPAVSDGTRTTVSVSLDRETLVVTVNGIRTQATNDSFFTLEEAVGDNGRFGFRAANSTSFRFTDAKLANQDISGDWEFLVNNTGQVFEETTIPQYTVTGVVVDEETSQPIADATVRVGAESAKTTSDGTFSVDVETGTYDVTASAAGYLANSVSGVEISANKALDEPIKLTKRVATVYKHYIQNENLKAAVGENFPQVYQYRLQTGGEEKIMSGQEAELTSVRINGTAIAPTMGTVEIKNDYAVYPMTLKSESASIDMAMTVKISVSENDLIWEVTDITKNSGCAKINKIEVPNLNLVTIISEQSNAEFMGATVSGDVTNSGDDRITFDNGFIAGNSKTYAYGFLSADGVSAGVWSNSEMASDKRLVRNNGMDSMSLTSAAWYYEYGDMAASANYDGTPLSELPKAKVCLTGDENKDGQVNWQDGAIAYRDIMNNPYGSENTKDLVNYRIVMNFSSQATNPFLKTADNIKKVYLATDGLPQAVMMKGFGSEGHDSANSEYGNIGERIGGLEELKKLNVIAHQYNTQTGIHINAQECYPEAQSFTNELVNGPTNTTNGWGWLDQSYTINRPYDLGSGLRYKRLLQLYDQLNDTSLYANKWPGVVGTGANETVASADVIADTVAQNKNNPENLDFMYLDVWYGDSWETRKIAQQFNSLGWRFSTEFGYEGEYDSTWQHWATEGHYGGGGMKGLNSDVIRFIRNHQKDSFVLNWPKYGGAADNPLLGGFDLAGFEGWGSNNNFDRYLTTTFAINLPTKFLQHYKVYKWENYEEGKSPVGNHEKQITLKSDDGKDTVVVTRNEKQRPDVGDSNELTHYNFVERTITLNGKKVLDDVNYLLPWTDWETNEEKLYHYNYDGGTSTWELPNGWTNLANVKVYTLTDAGRSNSRTVAVTGGKITLTAEPDTPYVVIKGTADTTPKSVTEWSNHAHVKDTGFNSYAGTGEGDALNSAVWTGDIADVKVVRVKSGNKYLQMGSETKNQKVSTTIEGLKPGTNYVAQVYVDNKSDAKAWIKVLGGTKNVSNYTLKSLAQNFVRCDAHNINAVSDSRMQTMLVSFTAKTSTAVLTLEREVGKGSTYFDDIRIVEKTLSNIKSNGDFEQDFETVVGGIYPFVIGPAQGVDDQVTHLSEKHAPYTQSGWGKQVLDDVIDGQWSLKHHGDNRGIIYRTIPQNLHLEPGTIYDISFDYQSGWGDNYYIVIGDGDTVVESLPNLEQTRAEQEGGHSRTEKFTFAMTASGSGQSWFGLAARGTGLGDDWRKSYGYVDFVLDNLKVEKRGASISPSGVTVSTAKDPIELAVSFDNEEDNSNPVKWKSSDESVAYVVPDAEDSKKCKAYFVDFGETEITAETTINFEEITLTSRLSFPETCDLPENEQKAAVWSKAYANTESDPKENAIDGASNTFWQTQWDGDDKFTPSEDNPAKLTVQASENILGMNRLHFTTRSGNKHGIVEKYRVVIGNEFDEETHTILSPTYTSEVITPKDYETDITSLSETYVFPNNVEGQFIQIQFLKGTGGSVTIATVELDKIGSNNTTEEKGYIGTNNSSQADKAKAALAAALEKAKVVRDAGQSTNSDESWQAFTAAYDAAVAGKDSTNADTLLQLQQTLTSAQNSLVPTVQAAQAKLSEELEEAQKITAQGSYTDESWEKFQKALEAANNAGSITDPAKVIRLQQALANAMKNLVSKAEEAQMRLQQVVSAAKEIIDKERGNYTNTSWTAFETAYNDARSKLTSEDLEELENAASDLEIKQNNLETNLQEAKKKLSEKLNEIKAEINSGQGDWSDTTWNAYLNVYANAEKALRSEDATVNGLNAWHQVLASAKESLETALVDVSRKLSEALSSAAAIKNKGQQSYTNTSWTAFVTAYNNAEAGKNSKDVAQLTDLLIKLTDAKNALVEEKFANGSTVIVNDVLYQVTDAAKKTVTAVSGTNKDGSTSIIIQNTVVVKGVTCDVTEISANAFKGFAKLKKVTIGSNVTKVGKEAFSGCKNLKNIKIQSKVLKSFGKKALKGTNAKLKVKVQKKMQPTKLRSKLIKQIKKAGNKKVKVK